ncbi:MAG: transposase [Albidovulum sp.]|nr:transposase [Albidovulum sp.]
MTTNFHTVADAKGLPFHYFPVPGQAHGRTVAGRLSGEHPSPGSFVVADRFFNAQRIRSIIEARDKVPVITRYCTSRSSKSVGKRLYIIRNGIERLFGKLKQFRRIATRYDSLAIDFFAKTELATSRTWSRTYESTFDMFFVAGIGRGLRLSTVETQKNVRRIRVEGTT